MTIGLPFLIGDRMTTVEPFLEDHALIVSASWEERCLGLARRLGDYRCKAAVLSIYDTPSAKREGYISELSDHLSRVSSRNVHRIPANHGNPLGNVRNIIQTIQSIDAKPRLTIDVSTFTRKHLLLLLQGLDHAGLMANSQFCHTEPADFDTQDDEPISQGISSVRVIETYIGHNQPSRDSLLILFLGYEGRRALALWEHLEPNVTLPVIPDPPYKEEWRNRTETQNCYLLSYLPKENIQRSHSLDPSDTESLLNRLAASETYNTQRFNYRIAPLGTKAQTLGIYRFCRNHLGLATVMYASPVKYREERSKYPVGRTWLVDQSMLWSASSHDR
jgi:hypothetical protein